MNHLNLQPVQVNEVKAREILDSRGFPTVEVDLVVKNPKHKGEIITVRGVVPSGASTGEGEALELRDGDQKRYLGKGVSLAVSNVNNVLASAVTGQTFANQKLFDQRLLEVDGTPNKSKCGANAILPLSMAFTRALAAVNDRSLFEMISSLSNNKGVRLPVPLMNILNGGKHADNGLAIQEFMIVPLGFSKFSEALQAGVQVFHHLKKILHSKGLSTGVGDEGGFAPQFSGEQIHEQVLNTVIEAISQAGYKAGKQIALALDCAASEFIDKGSSKGQEVTYLFEGKKQTSSAMVDLYSKWIERYPIVSIEDGLSEHDWAGWAQLTSQVGSRCQLVGDDLFVTNIEYLKKGIEQKSANAILIKLNQIGTVSETLETMKFASTNQFRSIVSHRSGETEDAFIADLAVGTDCGQIKTGSASRSDRLAKYNQLLRIQEQLGDRAIFAGAETYTIG